MASYFNVADMNTLLKDFYAICRIRVTVFDAEGKEVTSYPNRKARFCAYLRETSSDFEAACRHCDKVHMDLAKLQREPLIYTCHAGIYEIIAPLRSSDMRLVGFLFFSHILNYPSHKEAWSAVKKAVVAYGGDKETAHGYLDEMRLFNDEYLRSASTVLAAAANYLSEARLAGLRDEEAGERLDAYIKAHLSEDLSIDALCHVFSLSRTALYQLSGKLYDRPLASHIRRLRLEKAKSLLEENPSLSVSELSEKVGYPDYCHFIVCFKKEMGATPKKYAEALRKKVVSA
ncbi:MAG: PocR ligand-binding domain-containing protein [Bacilli bacterium]|nr:PocR ligand-binding domain-containing protein [Bacilli bacterium]